MQCPGARSFPGVLRAITSLQRPLSFQTVEWFGSGCSHNSKEVCLVLSRDSSIINLCFSSVDFTLFERVPRWYWQWSSMCSIMYSILLFYQQTLLRMSQSCPKDCTAPFDLRDAIVPLSLIFIVTYTLSEIPYPNVTLPLRQLLGRYPASRETYLGDQSQYHIHSYSHFHALALYVRLVLRYSLRLRVWGLQDGGPLEVRGGRDHLGAGKQSWGARSS